MRSKNRKFMSPQEIESSASGICIHHFITSDPQSTFNFHSGFKFLSHLNAYEGGDKILKMEIAQKLHFLRMKIITFKSHHKLTKRNLKKISPSGHAEFNCLSDVFIRFCVYVMVKKKSPRHMKHVEANFGQKTCEIT